MEGLIFGILRYYLFVLFVFLPLYVVVFVPCQRILPKPHTDVFIIRTLASPVLFGIPY